MWASRTGHPDTELIIKCWLVGGDEASWNKTYNQENLFGQ